MCARSLDILNRTVMVPTNPQHTERETAAIIHNVEIAARVTLGEENLKDLELMPAAALDAGKFDMPDDQQAE